MNGFSAYVAEGVQAVEFKLSEYRGRTAALRAGNNHRPSITVRDKADVEDPEAAFQPEMAHQIFGDTEKIFGYKDLRVLLYYNAGSLNVYYDTQCSDKLTQEQHSIKPDDISAMITDKFTGGYITDLAEFLSTIERDEKFQPFGEKVDEFLVKAEDNQTRIFEFYFVEMADQKFINYHQRFETFILWYVDAASYIDHDDPNWLYFLW